MTVATRTGFELEAAIESFRRNQRTRLASQTLDRLYIPRLLKLAAYLRAQGMPTDVSSIRREHLESYIEWLQHSAPGRTGAGQKSATVSISYRTLRTFFNWLVKEDELRKEPHVAGPSSARGRGGTAGADPGPTGTHVQGVRWARV